MFETAKNWEEIYGATIVDIDNDSVVFSLSTQLAEDKIDLLISEIKKLQGALPCYDDGYEKMRQDISNNNRFEIWWD